MQTVREAAQKAAEVVQEGAQKVAAAFKSGNGDEEMDQNVAQFRTQPEQDDGTASQEPGVLERIKESAAQAAEGVKMRFSLGSHGGDEEREAAKGDDATAEKRTGEPLHMAKAAEGRNKEQDNSMHLAMKDALRPQRNERPETSSFPETLGDALAVAQLKDLPNNPGSTPNSTEAWPRGEATDDGSVSHLTPLNSGMRARL